MKFIVSFICFNILFAFSAFGFDGNKNGLQLSFGAGLSAMQANFNDIEDGDHKEMNSTLSAYAFRFGYGFGDKFSLFFGKESHVYKYDQKDVLNEISAIGLKFQLSPSLYILGAHGIGGYVNEITLDSNKMTLGTGSFVGIGYEILTNFAFEVGMSRMQVDIDELQKNSVESPYEQTSSHVLFMIQLY